MVNPRTDGNKWRQKPITIPPATFLLDKYSQRPKINICITQISNISMTQISNISMTQISNICATQIAVD